MEMDLELTTTETKIKKEMRHFMALTVMSIAFGGIALALAISLITVNVFSLKMADWVILLNSVSNIGIGLAIAGLALWYIISTAEVMGKFEEIGEEKNGGANLPSERLTERIVNLIGLYREEKHQIKRMILVSKIAGTCFFVNAVLQTALLLGNPASGSVELIPAVGGILVSLVMGMVGFFLPFSFRKYSVCWDERVLKSAEAERKIATILEDRK